MTDEIKQRIEQIKRGEVPKGYKKTKVGIVPEEWECKTFDELFDFYGGLGIARDLLGDNGVPYLHYGDMHKNSFTKVEYEDYLKMPKYDINISGAETYLLKHGDLVFLDASEDLNGTSRCVLVYNPENKPFISGLHTFRAMAKDESIQLAFKQYITIPQKVRKQFMRLASGFKVYGVNGSTIKKISVSYPKDKNEQQRVADILSKWDEAIALQEKLIEKLEVQKKALMQRLLAPKEGWKKVKIGAFTRELSIRNNENNCKNIKSISNKFGFINQDEQFSKQVASQDTTNYKKVDFGNIAYNPSRINVGSIAVYNEKEIGIVSPMYVVFECKNISPRLLLLFLSTERIQYDIKSYLTGSVRDSLNYCDLKRIEIYLPNKDIQNKLNTFFELNETIYFIQTQKLSKLKQQQKALHQLLLTGIVRV